MNRKHTKLIIVGMAAMLFSASGFASGTNASDADSQAQSPTINLFGGQAYLGSPNLRLTAALLRAGGGADDFSTAKALTSMLGQDTVNNEIAKLTKQYGKDNVNHWLKGTDAVVADALKHSKEKGISLPAPADLKGRALAKALVKAGTTPNGTFWAGHFYDKLVSHDIHDAVMTDVNNNPKLGIAYDRNVHAISNQAFYDVAQALGMSQVKLAELH